MTTSTTAANTTFILVSETATIELPGFAGPYRRVYGDDVVVWEKDLAASVNEHAARATVRVVTVYECVGTYLGKGIKGKQVAVLARMSETKFVVAHGMQIEGFEHLTAHLVAA